MSDSVRPSIPGLRRNVHLALDSGIGGGRWSALTHRLIVTLIIISIAAMIIESVPAYAAAWRGWLVAIEIVVITGFSF